MNLPDYTANSTAVIDLAALRQNLETVRRQAQGAQIIAVVKADAYGHGAVEIARYLQQQKVDALGVAAISEAEQLRRAGISLPIILLFGCFAGDEQAVCDLDLSVVVYDLGEVSRLQQVARAAGKTIDVHLDVDTGMGRVGVSPDKAFEFASSFTDFPQIRLSGIMSHYAVADLADEEFTDTQAEKLNRIITDFDKNNIPIGLRHQSNSAAVLRGRAFPGNAVRPGIMLYGAYPSREMVKDPALKPVLTWTSKILYLKEVPSGTSISYGRTFTTSRTSRIATVPVGYADGYNRLLSNRGSMIVGGALAPVVGRVCMDLTMLDVTEISEVEIGDEVIVLGGDGNLRIESEDIAELTGTIAYEVLTSIGGRVRRRYING